MRVPLEILRLILDIACASYTGPEFLELRLTSYLFDEQVRSLFFPDHGLSSFRFYLLCGAASGRDCVRQPFWNSVPASLRHVYLQHRVKRQGVESSLFAHLFAPVYEAHLKKLGMSARDHAARHEKLKQWTGFFMHEYWKEAWVVTHASSPARAKELRHYDNYTISDDPSQRIENDRKFLELCCGIIVNDENAVLNAFTGFHSSVTDLNYCFGTTLLGFAVKHASHAMLKLLLRSVKHTSYGQRYKYLPMAVTWAREPSTTLDILLNHFIQHHVNTASRTVYVRKDSARKVLVQDLLLAATLQSNQLLFDALYEWMDAIPHFHGKIDIFEMFFTRNLRDTTACRYLLKFPVGMTMGRVRRRRAAEEVVVV